MALSSYNRSLDRLLVHEGGYTNHPSDPGGPTNWGITIYDARKYWKKDATAADVRAMRVSVAKAIYRSKYWDAMRCSELPAGVDYAVFDYGVNSGIGRAPKVLQRVLGVTVDGRIGPETLKALQARDPAAVVNAICDERIAFLRRLKTWPVFGKGWGRRVIEVRAFALELAAAESNVIPFPVPRPALPVEAAPHKAEIPAPKKTKDVIVGTGTTGAGGAGVTWFEWIQTHPIESALIAVAVAAAIGGAIYAINRWHRARQERPMPEAQVVPLKKAA